MVLFKLAKIVNNAKQILCNAIVDNIMVRLLLNSVTILVKERVTRQTETVATQDAHWTGPLYHKE